MKSTIRVVSDPVTTEGPMTSVEFRIARESLGVTGEVLAGHLGVSDRSIRKWEHGASAVPAGVRRELQDLVEEFDKAVAELVAAVAGVEAPVLVIESDGWSRMVAGRVAEETGARVKISESS